MLNQTTPPLIQARMVMWNTAKKPTLEAQQECADYLWELYDKDMLDVPLHPALKAHLDRNKAIKAKVKPVGWEKVEEEWGELMAETGNPKAERFRIDDPLDTPMNRPVFEQMLAAIGFPMIPIERFLQYSAWKLDGRLQYEQLNPATTSPERKEALKSYETMAARKVFDA